jgi:hypothetical protein
VSHNLKEIYVLNLIFLPLNIVSELGKIIPNLSLSEDILKSIKFSKEFINNSRDIVFRKAVFKAKAENGINIEKCELKGDFIRGLSVDGYIGFDKNIRIKSNLNINKIIVPVDIYGTIDNPIPDLKSFVLLFMKENTLNALNPENIKDIIDVLDRGGKDAPDKKRKKFFDLLKIKN